MYVDPDELVHPYQHQINRLKARRGLDPRDPDALDEEEEKRLEALEAWEP